ncbi:MAG: tRNA (adenosine(37)-N6)-dimethylallyltransferase MiaA [Chitinophagales bacterium]|nr:tRNA (adenosine(37)-N6)-dimethylallyltransferase MiaA [Chitinophagales bacterium]
MKNLIVICGPTASGKTDVAIHLATELNCDIVNADSRQVYAEMNIGTAKPTDEQLQQVKHHLISSRSIFQGYSAGEFMTDAKSKIDELFIDMSFVVLVGGSGLYIKAITEGLDIFPEVDPEIREELNRAFAEEGIEYLQNLLKQKDPAYFAEVDLDNPRRLIRALEVYITSGKPYSHFLAQNAVKPDYNVVKIGIETDRNVLYDQINSRVNEMIEMGLVHEAKDLLEHKEINALQTVGYQELFDYLDGEIELEEAIDKIKQNSRRYAKRQMTWFRKDEEIEWFERSATDEIVKFIKKKTGNEQTNP